MRPGAETVKGFSPRIMMSNAAVTSLPASYSAQPALATDWSRTLGTLLLGALVLVPHFPLRVDEDFHFSTIDIQSILRMGLCAICGLYGLAHLQFSLGNLGRFPLAWMMLLGLWATVTVPFAIDPLQAVATSGVLWCILLFVPAAVEILGLTRAVQTILLGSTLYLVGQWVLFFTVTELGRSAEFLPNGEIVYRLGADSQQLGLQAAALIGLVIILKRRGQLSSNWLWLLISLAIVTLIGAKSRTAAIGVLAGIAFIGLRRLEARRLAVLGGITAASACVIMFLFATDTASVNVDSVAASVSRSGTAEEITTITGRSEIWDFVLKKTSQSPVIGWGYGCAVAAGQEYEPHLRHAHNELLNAALCLGIVGVILTAGMFMQQIIAVCTSRDELPLFVTVLTIIAGITEPVLLLTMPTVLMILWILVLCRAPLEAPSINTPNKLCG